MNFIYKYTIFYLKKIYNNLVKHENIVLLYLVTRANYVSMIEIY